MALGAPADDDGLELIWVRQPALGGDGAFKRGGFRHWLLGHGAGSNLHVLFADGRDHIRRRQPPGGHPFRIQPDAHREFAAAENWHVADARDSQQAVPDG